MKMNVAVFMGGKSTEHEISCISASQVIKALDENKYEIIPIYITGYKISINIMKKNKKFQKEQLRQCVILRSVCPVSLSLCFRILIRIL